MIMLHHGTTLAAANRILKEGWAVRSPEEQVALVARDYGKEPAALMEHLGRRNRFATTATRGHWASFALSEEIAIRNWAQRAPEVRWEALWGIWWLDHPEAPFEVRTVSKGGLEKEVEVLPLAGEIWVFQQMYREPLAVVSLSMSYEKLIGLNAKTEGFEHEPLPSARALSGRGGPQPPGVAVPCPFRPPGSRLTMRPIERIVHWYVFAYLLGLSDEEFQHRDRLGEFGVPASDSATPLGPNEGRPWWTLSAVQHHLPSS